MSTEALDRLFGILGEPPRRRLRIVTEARMRNERLHKGIVIRPSLLGFQTIMTILFFSGAGAFLLVALIVIGVKQHSPLLLAFCPFAACAVVAPYFILRRHFVFIGEELIAHGWRRDKPSEITERARVAHVWFATFDAMGNRGRLFAADGTVLMTFQPIITSRQMRKIARILDRPYNQPFSASAKPAEAS